MKIAIPLFGDRISPRFDCAQQFRIVSVINRKIAGEEKIVMSSQMLISRVEELERLGVRTVICGAINEFTLRLLENRGIAVMPWIVGNADEVLNSFLCGDLRPGITFMPDGRRLRRRLRCGKKRGKQINYLSQQ